MLTKTKLALAAIAVLGAACTVQAADKDDGPGGFRVGPLGQDLAAPPQERQSWPYADGRLLSLIRFSWPV